LSKYNFYSGFMGRSLFTHQTLSPPLLSPRTSEMSPRRKRSNVHAVPESDDDNNNNNNSNRRRESPSRCGPRLLDHLESPPRSSSSSSSSSSDPESGSESEKHKESPVPELTASGSTAATTAPGGFGASTKGRDPPAAVSAAAGDIMSKIFPLQKRDTLESAVRTCHGDVVRAIQLLLGSQQESRLLADAQHHHHHQHPHHPQHHHNAFSFRPGFGLAGTLQQSRPTLVGNNNNNNNNNSSNNISNKSAFSPLHAHAAWSTPSVADGLYGLGPRFGISPLRLAYTTSSSAAGVGGAGGGGGAIAGFMSPYVTAGGALSAFPGLRPPLDYYAFPGVLRDLSYLQGKESLCSPTYGHHPPNHEKQL